MLFLLTVIEPDAMIMHTMEIAFSHDFMMFLALKYQLSALANCRNDKLKDRGIVVTHRKLFLLQTFNCNVDLIVGKTSSVRNFDA